MKKIVCLCLLFILLVCCIPCSAEVTMIPADEDDLATVLEEAFAQMELDYSHVTLNRKDGIFVIDIAIDGLTENLLSLKKDGYDETFDEWVQFKGSMLSLHGSILDMFKTVHREDLRLILNVVNDDAFIRQDYSTISHNPLLSIGVLCAVSVDELADDFVIETPLPKATPAKVPETTYILNTNSKKFHFPTCDSAIRTKEKNKKEYHGTREELIDVGYSPCGVCHP